MLSVAHCVGFDATSSMITQTIITQSAAPTFVAMCVLMPSTSWPHSTDNTLAAASAP